jgi:hypothetical protein
VITSGEGNEIIYNRASEHNTAAKIPKLLNIIYHKGDYFIYRPCNPE